VPGQVGYCQAMNFVAAHLLLNLGPADGDARGEEAAFWALAHRPRPARGGRSRGLGVPLAFPYASPFCMGILHGRAGGFTAPFGGCRPGQSPTAPCLAVRRPPPHVTYVLEEERISR
jgi:hypothetical protein